ncbi:MAG: hypothetical protein BRC22_00735, partial [Parcubacteria group bacterium QH_9_35_7]
YVLAFYIDIVILAQLRFIRSNFNLSKNKLEITDRRLIHKIKNVLRMKAKDKIELCNGKQEEATAEILKINKDKIKTKLLERHSNDREPDKKITLYCSILKNKNFELVVEKATELGVSQIVPIISDRTVKTGLKSDRLNKKIREAAEQSGRGVLPQLQEKVKLKTAIKQDQNEMQIAFDEAGKEVSEIDIAVDNISIFVGPEGGWSKKEKQMFEEKNFDIAKLSDLTFRAETAAIVGSYEVLR